MLNTKMIPYNSILKLTIRDSSKLIIDPRNLIKTFPNLRALLILRGKFITIITSFPADAKIRVNIFLFNSTFI